MWICNAFVLTKPVNNAKLFSGNVSLIYASSVSKLVKPLNVSIPVCSSNTTKRNVCITSSASQSIKPLNVSKPACSSNVTKRNVGNAKMMVNSSNYWILANLSFPVIQLNVLSVTPVVIVNSSNHQLYLSVPIMWLNVMSVTAVVLAKLPKNLMFVNLLVTEMQPCHL